MSLETDLVLTLQGQCPRVFPISAPLDTPRPFVTYTQIGGDSLRYVENTAADKRLALEQIDVWAASKAEALGLIQSIEDALCASALFVAKVAGEPRDRLEQDVEPWLYGMSQDFEVLGAR